MALEVVILMGLPGAGKSSFFRARFADSHVHVSKDLWPNAKNKARRQREALRAALATGRSVVVDNTNISKAQRAEIFEAISPFAVRVVGFYFLTSLDECLTHNAAREGRARVPDVALHVINSNLELPALEEGFNALFRVELGAPGEFLVLEWPHETPLI